MIVFKRLSCDHSLPRVGSLDPRFMLSKIRRINSLGRIYAQNQWFVRLTGKILISKNLVACRTALSGYTPTMAKIWQLASMIHRAIAPAISARNMPVSSLMRLLLCQQKSTGRGYEGNRTIPEMERRQLG